MTNPFRIQYRHASKHELFELYKLGYLNASLFRQFQEDIQTNQSRYKLLVLQINKASWTCMKGTIHKSNLRQRHCYHPNVHPPPMLASCTNNCPFCTVLVMHTAYTFILLLYNNTIQSMVQQYDQFQVSEDTFSLA